MPLLLEENNLFMLFFFSFLILQGVAEFSIGLGSGYIGLIEILTAGALKCIVFSLGSARGGGRRGSWKLVCLFGISESSRLIFLNSNKNPDLL